MGSLELFRNAEVVHSSSYVRVRSEMRRARRRSEGGGQGMAEEADQFAGAMRRLSDGVPRAGRGASAAARGGASPSLRSLAREVDRGLDQVAVRTPEAVVKGVYSFQEGVSAVTREAVAPAVAHATDRIGRTEMARKAAERLPAAMAVAKIGLGTAKGVASFLLPVVEVTTRAAADAAVRSVRKVIPPSKGTQGR